MPIQEPNLIPDRSYALSGDAANEWSRAIIALWDELAQLRQEGFRKFVSVRIDSKVDNYVGLYRGTYVEPRYDLRFGTSNSGTGSYTTNTFGPAIIGNQASFQAYIVNPFDWDAKVHTLDWSNNATGNTLSKNCKIYLGEFIGDSSFPVDGTNSHLPVLMLGYENPGYLPVSLTHVATGSYAAVLTNGVRVGGPSAVYPIENAPGDESQVMGLAYYYYDTVKLFVFGGAGGTSSIPLPTAPGQVLLANSSNVWIAAYPRLHP